MHNRLANTTCSISSAVALVVLINHKMGTVVTWEAFSHARMPQMTMLRHGGGAESRPEYHKYAWYKQCADARTPWSAACLSPVGVPTPSIVVAAYGHGLGGKNPIPRPFPWNAGAVADLVNDLDHSRTLVVRTHRRLRVLMWTRDSVELVLSSFFYHLALPRGFPAEATFTIDRSNRSHAAALVQSCKESMVGQTWRFHHRQPPCSACARVASERGRTSLGTTATWVELLRSAPTSVGLAMEAWLLSGRQRSISQSAAVLALPPQDDVLRLDVDRLSTSHTATFAQLFLFLGVRSVHDCLRHVAWLDRTAGGVDLHASMLTTVASASEREALRQELRGDRCLMDFLAGASNSSLRKSSSPSKNRDEDASRMSQHGTRLSPEIELASVEEQLQRYGPLGAIACLGIILVLVSFATAGQ